MPAPTSPQLELGSPVQFLRGCGPQKGALLAKLGVRTIGDLLFYFPRDYQDFTSLREYDQLEEGVPCKVWGLVEEVDHRYTRQGKSVVGILLRQGETWLRATWFNQSYLADKLKAGQRIMLAGKPSFQFPRWEMKQPLVRWLAEEDEPLGGELLPLYSLTAGLSQYQLRQLVRTALDEFVSQLPEVFPADYLAAHQLLPLAQALPQLHFPQSAEELATARRRFVYQELLVLQIALTLRRQQRQQHRAAFPLSGSPQIDQRIRRLLPFALTANQDRVIVEIGQDLARPLPMNRLLQGDVGTGKTIVAVYAMLVAVANGTQAALMAPTEILSRQHYQTLTRLLRGSQVRIGLFTGALTTKERREALRQIEAGEWDLVVGTQALIEPEVRFAKLSLVVIDEQHRFGVRQRAALRQGGEPHYLVMTATPIPRTVAMTLFGDLDASTLSDPPLGRQTVHTYVPPEADWGKWWDFVRRKLKQGRQAYVIVPAVDANEEAAHTSLEETYETLANGELEAFRLGLMHGRMSPAEKAAAMDRFAAGETQVLIATTVVEVGIDVPNATVMTVLDAQRFGLAQLHQLRGRVSRGKYPGFCCLLATTEDQIESERLQAMLRTSDGFELAEIDYRLRGPGDLFGDDQHGFPPLRIADLLRDQEVLAEARGDAQALLQQDPGLTSPAFASLRKMVLVRYGRVLELGDVG